MDKICLKQLIYSYIIIHLLFFKNRFFNFFLNYLLNNIKIAY